MLVMVNEMVMEWAILKAFRIHRMKTFPEYLAMPALWLCTILYGL